MEEVEDGSDLCRAKGLRYRVWEARGSYQDLALLQMETARTLLLFT